MPEAVSSITVYPLYFKCGKDRASQKTCQKQLLNSVNGLLTLFSVIMRGLILALAAIGSINFLWAQQDSVNLDTAVVCDIQYQSEVFLVPTIDVNTVHTNPNNSIGGMLQSEVPVYVKEYGYGGIMNLQYRGASAAQNQIMVNKIPVNSVTLGQTDLSIWPSDMFGAASLAGGGASLMAGGGSVGANLTLKPSQLDTNHHLQVEFGFGSFENYLAKTDLQYQLGNWKARTYISYQTVANNFTYQNTAKKGHPEEELTHAEWNRIAFNQSFVRSTTKGESFVHFYGVDMNKNLPGTMSAPSDQEQQLDDWLMLTAGHKFYGRQSITEVSVAGQIQNSEYIDFDTSLTTNNSLHLDLQQSRYYNRLKWNWGVHSDVYESVKADQYQNKITHTESFWSSADYQMNEDWVLNLGLRVATQNNKWAKPMPVFGFKRQSAESTWEYGASINGLYRFPTVNDLYWQPGGNEDLLAESGFNTEGYVFKTIGESSSQLTIGAKVYYQQVQNWIQWTPSETASYWDVQNLDEVTNSGFELNAKWYLVSGLTKITVMGNYAFNQSLNHTVDSEDPSFGKQLIYNPKHLFNYKLGWQRNLWMSQLSGQVIGKRYTDSNNQNYLEAFALLNAFVGYNFLKNQWSYTVGLNVNNVTNSTYYNLPDRPMPGVNYLLTIKINYDEK